MPISLHQLSVFRAVARHQSFTRAAEELFISQPAVSAHVRELERHYGVELFEAVGRRVRLTEAGRLLEDCADRILGLVEESQRTLDELKGLRRGHLSVGASTIPAAYLLPRELGRFKERYPDVAVALRMGDTHQVLGMVRRGEVEIAVVGDLHEARMRGARAHAEGAEASGKPDIEWIQRQHYQSDELVLVVWPRHRWAQEGLPNLSELAHEPFILRERGSSTREHAEAMLRELGIWPHSIMEWQSTEAIKQAVEAGLGVSILSDYAVALELESGRLCRVRHPALARRRQFFIVSHQDRRLSPAARTFRDLLMEAAPPGDSAE
jgi:LysR family transcriptional regulator, low CO2-responsive transcriptional regulator